MRVAGVIALVLSALAASAYAGEDRDAIFERANQAYLHGDYAAAIDGYEKLIAAGVINEDLHYNLGNAYFKADRLGPAILHYQRSLQIEPGAEDADENLKLARETSAARFQDRLQGADRDPLWIRATAPFSLGGLGLGFLGLYIGLFALSGLTYLRRPGLLRVGLTVVVAFAGIATVAGGGLLGARFWLENRVERAVVLPDELQVKEGPGSDYQTAFVIHAGLGVRVAGADQDWARVRLANGLEGWVRARDLGHL